MRRAKVGVFKKAGKEKGAEAMYRHVRIDITQYELKHNKPPAGHGVWHFKVGEKAVTYTGKYNDATKQVTDDAEHADVKVVYLLP
ncbi:MAG: hypothetical protein ACOY4D_11850 [Pseudomonadota bacterium]